MTWVRWFLVGLIGGLSVLGLYWRLQDRAGGVAVDFVETFAAASVVRPNPGVFTVTDVTIANVTLPSVVASQASRIAWEVTVPDHAWLEVNLGVRDAVSATGAEGIVFRVGLSFDEHYEELVNQTVTPDPAGVGQGWRPIEFDLAPYAGRTVSVIFNTSPAGGGAAVPPAAWGQPRLVLR